MQEGILRRQSREWTVIVQRHGKEVVLKPRQLVLATGMSAKPNMPKFEGMDIFKGDQHHSSQHPGPDKYRNKKAVVIGSNNSATIFAPRCGKLEQTSPWFNARQPMS